MLLKYWSRFLVFPNILPFVFTCLYWRNSFYTADKELLLKSSLCNVFFGGNEKGKNKPGNMGDLLQYHLVRMNATLKSPLAWGWFRLKYNDRISTVEFSQNRFVAGLKMWDAVVCLGHHPGTEWWEKPSWDPPTEYEWRYSYIIPSKRLLRKGMDIRIDKMGISY